MTERLNSTGYRFGTTLFYPTAGVLIVDGERRHLRGRESQLLKVLIDRYPDVVCRDELSDTVWQGTYVTDASINQAIKELRNELSDVDKLIVRTVPKKGYLLAVEPLEVKHKGETEGSLKETRTIPFSSVDTGAFRENLGVFFALVLAFSISGVVGYLFAASEVPSPSLVKSDMSFLFEPTPEELEKFSGTEGHSVVFKRLDSYRVCTDSVEGMLCQLKR